MKCEQLLISVRTTLVRMYKKKCNLMQQIALRTLAGAVGFEPTTKVLETFVTTIYSV